MQYTLPLFVPFFSPLIISFRYLWCILYIGPSTPYPYKNVRLVIMKKKPRGRKGRADITDSAKGGDMIDMTATPITRLQLTHME